MTTATGTLAPRVGSRAAAARGTRRLWGVALVLAVVVGGAWVAVHGVAGVTWIAVAEVFRGLEMHQMALLGVIWLGGLGIYATVLSAALPGLGIRRSLLLNLSGSAVANAIPLGGAVATGMNWRMVRTWGHSNLAFATFCVLTNTLDVATKLLLPVVAVAALAAVSAHIPTVLWGVSAVCAGVLLLTWITQAVALRPVATGHDLELGGPHGRAGRGHAVRKRLLQTVASTSRLLRARWRRLVPASVAYVAAQVVLLVFSLRAVGLDAPVTIVLMAAAIERLGTLVPVTPGGAGVAEIGTIAWLVGNGLDSVEVVAGVLLYRIILIAMEIPVGGVLLGGWVFLHAPAVGERVDSRDH